MDRPDEMSNLEPSEPDDSVKPIDSIARLKQRRLSRRRVVAALTLSLLGGMILIWFMQQPAEDATESHTVHIQSDVSDLETKVDPVLSVDPPEVSVGLAESDDPEVQPGGPVLLGDLISQSLVDKAEHPLDPVLAVAQLSMEEIDTTIRDYTCVITSQIFIHGRLDKERRMRAKLRHAGEIDGKRKPFGVYLDFLSPRSLKGQEVIWVEGMNDGKLVAHSGSGFLRLKRMHLEPDGPIAMRDSKYPIWDIGIRNLIEKMYEIGCCDRDDDDCQVIVTPGVKVEGRVSTLIEIKHDEQKEIFQFHHAKIYVDNERKIPIGYEGYSWPSGPDEPPPLMEKFYYTDMNLNVGLKDIDFDPENPDYRYPSW